MRSRSEAQNSCFSFAQGQIFFCCISLTFVGRWVFNIGPFNMHDLQSTTYVLTGCPPKMSWMFHGASFVSFCQLTHSGLLQRYPLQGWHSFSESDVVSSGQLQPQRRRPPPPPQRRSRPSMRNTRGVRRFIEIVSPTIPCGSQTHTWRNCVYVLE